MSGSIIEISNLKKDYKTGEVVVHALTGVNFELKRGGFVVILGPSGCGKTTLLNLIGGIDTKTEGTIKVNGREITALSEKDLTDYRKEDVGFIFQFYNLIPTLTAVENIELAARLKFPKEGHKRSLDMLEAVGIENLAHKFPPQLSGGEQQRVAIARALVKEPKIVLADEPTGNLDSETSEKILQLMFNISKNQGTTFLIVTHNVSISKNADLVIYLKDGVIYGTSQPQEGK